MKILSKLKKTILGLCILFVVSTCGLLQTKDSFFLLMLTSSSVGMLATNVILIDLYKNAENNKKK
ncbi:MAG: hypothetical protein H6Q13_3435 [Bacteroidetes bacterium]|nr:hypothetical protein [Bacteroidota bacterium]